MCRAFFVGVVRIGKAAFLTGVCCSACSSWPGLAPAGDRLSCCTSGVPAQKKVGKETCPHPASPTAPRSGAIGATCAHSKCRRAVELVARQGAPLKQPPQVRARSLAALRQPNRRYLLRSQALAERGGEEQPNSLRELRCMRTSGAERKRRARGTMMLNTLRVHAGGRHACLVRLAQCVWFLFASAKISAAHA